MYKIINGALRKIDGTYKHSSIVNYNLLSDEEKLADGCLYEIHNQPEYNTETQHLQQAGFTIDGDTVILNYEIIDNVVMEEVVSTEEVLEDLIRELTDKGLIL